VTIVRIYEEMVHFRERIYAIFIPYAFLMNPLFDLDPVCAKNK
jgi:hypothetical protein